MNDDKINENLIVKLSFEFSLMIIEFAEGLELKRKFVVANQLLKSGTSVGANIWEAQNAESKADFIHKMKISAKECDETKYWLLLCKHSTQYPNCDGLLEKIEVLQKVLNKIISTSKRIGN
ncbi:four helix bundle protein [Pedobacter yonginense]|uniref:Four helix bundle protein n=1 Tax=Pedobacter yonginense TaxID=651869 RepID=A0A317EVM8_9SPHI|nr:four helix bundle protein [Pedobacter yonginense]PWS29248.1 four helix bundle protein [Pedobacter yonginense]